MHLQARIRQACVYCGSSDLVPSIYLEAASTMGRALAVRGITLVFGGGRTGLMGALADAVLTSGGSAIGVIPEAFNTVQLAHAELTELKVVKDMHTRKAMMAEMADAFIALPGGFGTFEELFEVLTWAQVGIHAKPIGVLNTSGYFDLLLHLIEQARSEGFLYDEHPLLLTSHQEPEKLLDRIDMYRPPQGLERWVSRQEES